MIASSLMMIAALQTPVQVQVTPAEATIPVGATVELAATAASGAAFDVGQVIWRSTDPALASVDGGQVQALTPGTVRIAATVEGGVGFALITITETPADRLQLSLPIQRIPAGGSAPLMWEGRAGQGEAERTAPVSGSVGYRSSDPEVASVDVTGRVSGHRPGTATITAQAGGVSGAMAIEVGPAGSPSLSPRQSRVRTGDVVRLTVGDDYAPAWSVSGSGAAVSGEGTQGVFVAEEPGQYFVTARIGDAGVETAVIDVVAREYDAELTLVGRGAISDHHSGDMWVFEGVDGRDYVYVGTYLHDWMKVWDVTDAANPVLTDSLQLDARRINDVKIHPNNRIGILTREGASDRRNGIVMLDLSTPARPEILSEYTETVSGGVHNVWIDGDRDLVYAAHNGTSSIHILDISDPSAVTEVGRWGLEKDQKTLHDVIIQDGYAYLSYWDDGILMLDVGAGTHGGTPTVPTEVSRFAYPIGSTHVAWRAGRYLFIGDELFPPGWDAEKAIHARGYIHVVDYQDPDNPVEVARYEVPEAGVHNIWIEGDRMYLGYYQAGLRVVDISGELRGDLYAQGREVARILTTDDDTMVPNWPMTWGAQIHKGRIYSSDLNSGIWITQLRERRIVFQE